jgi:hypothetical protein
MRFFVIGFFHESTPFDFPLIILRKGMPYRRIVCKKKTLSLDFTMDKPAFTQNNPRKVLTFQELYPGKACLSGV